VKTNPCKVRDIRVFFFDLSTPKAVDTMSKEGKDSSVKAYSVHQPSAMATGQKKQNTDNTEEHGLIFHGLFFDLKSLDFYMDFRGFASAWGTPPFNK